MTREQIEARLAELKAKQEAATGWGAAVGARHEQIKELESQLLGMNGSSPETVDALKRCPFCGGEPVLRHIRGSRPFFVVNCKTGNCPAIPNVSGNSVADAIKGWNTRAGHAQSPAWQPIETAPRDGTPILLASIDPTGTKSIIECSWWSQERCAQAEGGSADDYEADWYQTERPELSFCRPTHWQSALEHPCAVTSTDRRMWCDCGEPMGQCAECRQVVTRPDQTQPENKG